MQDTNTDYTTTWQSAPPSMPNQKCFSSLSLLATVYWFSPFPMSQCASEGTEPPSDISPEPPLEPPPLEGGTMLAAEVALGREGGDRVSGGYKSLELGDQRTNHGTIPGRRHHRSLFFHCEFVCRIIERLTMVAHFVCALFTGYITYSAHQPASTLFSWHPTLMSLAFAFFMAEAILVFSPQSSLLQQKPRKSKVVCHWMLMICSAVCAVSGFAAIYYNKELHGKPHLKSWHGILGIVTVVYVIVQCCGGVNLLYPQLSAKFVKLASLKQTHATSGLLLYLLATFSLVTGMFSNWFTASVTGTSWYACVACPMLLLLIVTNQIKNAYLQK